MNKKLLYIGIILVVVGIVISLMLPTTLSPNIGKISIAPLGYVYVPITINETGATLVVEYLASNLTNFYLANSSGFAALSNLMTTNYSILPEAKRLLGNGVIAIIANSTSGIFPSSSNLNSTNQASIASMAPGRYYLIYENLKNKTIQLAYTYKALNSVSEISIFASGLASTILFIAGIIILILAFIIKPKAKAIPDRKSAQTQMEAEIDALYKRIEKGKKGSNGK
ncbi:MAG: hypothetical protein QXV80_00055 [Candidatus Micrarchaeaceae archaeon]